MPGVIGGAFRLLGYGFVPGSWGAGVGVYTPCIEASTALGINFLIQSDVTVRVSVNMPANLPIFDGGECQGDYSVVRAELRGHAAPPQFTHVSMFWNSFVGGRPAAFDPSRIVGINFQALYPGEDFVFSVDELEFFFF